MPFRISSLLEWFEHHPLVSWWLGSVSILMFLGFLIAIPVLIIRLPADYFLNQTSADPDRSTTISFLHLAYVFFKNLVGIVFILAGFAMLFLPGQGIITLIIGISLLNIPGKHRLFIVILKQEKVLHSMNRLRAKYNKPEFQISR